MLRIQLKTISITSVTQYHTKSCLWWDTESTRDYNTAFVAEVITDVVLPCHTTFWIKKDYIKSGRPDIQGS